ncbi:uncharacterized protein LOC125279803 isoform X4 [Megalobrama amblycephala]|uniref:uncharacterized protein LOC125279803 isoform X4 n=1 Tax=Megalobrama amblycephala TaxID=75352 RepID=UPI002014039C|nr:uncharacterized protein LOC125279803 isoform X4 [Megalobrama amblycephala]
MERRTNRLRIIEKCGFSVSHIMVLILCISASGSALLLCCLIYCRSPDNDKVIHLQMFLVFCPNILMFLAFVLWGVSEGSLNETVFCCVHYLLRPLMLLYAAPYAHDFTGSIGLWIQRYTHRTQYTVFSAVFFAVIFKYVLDKGLNYTGLDGYMVTVLFVIVLLLYLYYIFSLCAKFVGILCEKGFEMFSAVAGISFNILPSFQFILLYYTFGTTRGVFFIVAVLPLFLTITNYSFDYTCGTQMGCSPLVARSVWVVFMFLANSVMVYLYTVALETEEDRIGWAFMIAFLQALWAVLNFTWSFRWEIHRVVSVYLFGSVVIVLLNSVALMTELILKTVNGDRAVGDLRIIVFSSDFFFPLCLLILLVFEPWIKICLQSRQNAACSDETSASGSD